MPNPKNTYLPPHSRYMVRQMIDAGNYREAQTACDANVEWFEAQADAYRNLWREATIRGAGNIPVTAVPYEFTPVLDPSEQANR